MRRCNFDWQVCQIRLNDSNKLTGKTRSRQLKISELVLVPSEAFELNGIQFYSELTQESIDNVNLITKQVSICIHNCCFLGNIQDKIPLFVIIRGQRSWLHRFLTNCLYTYYIPVCITSFINLIKSPSLAQWWHYLALYWWIGALFNYQQDSTRFSSAIATWI